MEIDPATLGQYTGAKDINGKEIYEGDILMFHASLPYVLQEYRLIGNCPDYGFCQHEYYDREDRQGNVLRIKRPNPLTIYGISQGAIVANIHDNPKFLEAYK